MVRSCECSTQVALHLLMIAYVIHPDAVEVLGVLDVPHSAERNIYLPVGVIIAFLHLGIEHSNDGKPNTVPAD